MSLPSLRLFSLASLSLLLMGPAVLAKRLNIIVNAEADEEYMAKAEKLEYQTYHILKGKFHGGFTRDRGLEEAPFEALVESLALSLKKRNMYPESDHNKGDLLIMVSWGRTAVDADWSELQGITGPSEESSGGQGAAAGGSSSESFGAGSSDQAGANFSGVSDSSGNWGFGVSYGSSRARNMALLGLQGNLRSRNVFGYTPDEDLWQALDEERYFVILNAFDYQHLLKEKQLKQVWRVRYNTRATGVGFQQAYNSMTDAVAGVIGLQLDKIDTVKGDTKGSVSMGEVEMLKLSEDERKEVGE